MPHVPRDIRFLFLSGFAALVYQVLWMQPGHVARVRGDDEGAQHDLAQALERLPLDGQMSGPFMALNPLVQ